MSLLLQTLIDLEVGSMAWNFLSIGGGPKYTIHSRRSSSAKAQQSEGVPLPQNLL